LSIFFKIFAMYLIIKLLKMNFWCAKINDNNKKNANHFWPQNFFRKKNRNHFWIRFFLKKLKKRKEKKRKKEKKKNAKGKKVKR